MKKSSLLFIAFSLSAMLMAQEPLTTSQQQVQQTVINMFGALSNRDSVSLKSYCTSDVTLYEYGQVWNMDTLILKAITQNQAAGFKRSNHFDFINTQVKKNTAWVSYHLRSEYTRYGNQGSAYWIETVVLVKEKKRWKIEVLHSTLIKRT